jgi:hypothetical protein
MENTNARLILRLNQCSWIESLCRPNFPLGFFRVFRAFRGSKSSDLLIAADIM